MVMAKEPAHSVTDINKGTKKDAIREALMTSGFTTLVSHTEVELMGIGVNLPNTRQLEQAVDLANDLLQGWQEYLQDEKSDQLRTRVDVQAEALLNFLMTHFQGTLSRAGVAQMFKSTESGLDPAYLATLPDGSVPVAVMREVLNRSKVMFNPRYVPSWKTYVRRYGENILNA